MIPIDYFARALCALRQDAPQGGIFHIVSSETVKVETIIEYVQRYYRIRGMECVWASAFEEKPRSVLEQLCLDYTAPYRPYMLDRRRFEDAAARSILLPRNITCPPFSYELFCRLMRFADSAEWGKRLMLLHS